MDSVRKTSNSDPKMRTKTIKHWKIGQRASPEELRNRLEHLRLERDPWVRELRSLIDSLDAVVLLKQRREARVREEWEEKMEHTMSNLKNGLSRVIVLDTDRKEFKRRALQQQRYAETVLQELKEGKAEGEELKRKRREREAHRNEVIRISNLFQDEIRAKRDNISHRQYLRETSEFVESERLKSKNTYPDTVPPGTPSYEDDAETRNSIYTEARKERINEFESRTQAAFDNLQRILSERQRINDMHVKITFDTARRDSERKALDRDEERKRRERQQRDELMQFYRLYKQEKAKQASVNKLVDERVKIEEVDVEEKRVERERKYEEMRKGLGIPTLDLELYGLGEDKRSEGQATGEQRAEVEHDQDLLKVLEKRREILIDGYRKHGWNELRNILFKLRPEERDFLLAYHAENPST